MAAPKHYHYHHHYKLIYMHSLKRHLVAVISVLVVLVITIIYLFNSIAPQAPVSGPVSAGQLVQASTSSLLRLTIAYFLALIFSVPLALLITSTPKVERLLLPFFDVLESVPILAFFPIVVLVFIKIHYFEGAAIFILFMSMVWSLVFSMIGGLKTIPEDIKEAAFIFKAKGLKKLWFVTLPSIFPFIVTGSILAFAAGWNILIIAEVLHNYIPGSSASSDLSGLGNILVNSSLAGNQANFIWALVLMVLIIALINFFVWQKLLKLAERYKFE